MHMHMHANVALASSYVDTVYFITDIDECVNNNGLCSNNCVNTVGSYYCECPAGYALQPNHHVCEGRPQF